MKKNKSTTIQNKNITNYIITVLIIIIDQTTKILSINKDIIIIPKLLKFSYIQNSGAIFGMFEKNIVLIIDIIIIIGISIYWKISKRNQKSNLNNIAFILIIAGSIGNLLDRIFRGYVIDFIKLVLWDNLPIFNLADIFIVSGFMIIILVFFKDLSNKKENC